MSDLFTLYGVVLALLAFLSKRDREQVFLKFDIFDRISLAFVFVFVHYLFCFDWLRVLFPQLSAVVIAGWPTTQIWAYILSTAVIFYLAWKIFWAAFPERNLEAVKNYLSGLLRRQDYSHLIEIIESYFINDIIVFIDKKRNLKYEEPEKALPRQISIEGSGATYSFPIPDGPTKKEVALKDLEGQPKFSYSNWILINVIKNELFVKATANQNPELFLKIIRLMNKADVIDSEFARLFLSRLMLEKNSVFFKEIRSVENLDSFDAYKIPADAVFMSALLLDLDVAELNGITYGICEPVITELQYEAANEFSKLRRVGGNDKDEFIWSTSIRAAIHFMDVLIRKAISEGRKDHFWLYYLNDLLKGLIQNIKQDFSNPIEVEKSMNVDLIREILSIYRDWIQVVVKSKHLDLLESIIKCRVWSWVALSKSEMLSDQFLRDELKSDFISLFELYSLGDDHTVAEKALEESYKGFLGDNALLQLNNSNPRKHEVRFVNNLLKAWDKRDIHGLHGFLGDRANRFQDAVVVTLKKAQQNWLP